MSSRFSKDRRRLVRTARWTLNYWYLMLIPYVVVGYGLYYWMFNYLDVMIWIGGTDSSGGWEAFLLSFLFIPVLLLALGYWFMPPVAVLIMFVIWKVRGRRSVSSSMKGYLEELSG